MRKIYKYQLRVMDHQIISIPGLYEVLSVAIQYGGLVLYATIDPDKVCEISCAQIEIQIIGTGHLFKEIGEEWTFMGTHSMAGGSLMWHVWYKSKKG